MKKKVVYLLLTLMSLGSITACGKTEPTKEYPASVLPEITEPSDPIIKEDNPEICDLRVIEPLNIYEVSNYENNTYEHLESMIDYLYNEKNKNVILSGTSLDMALGMAMLGSDEETLTDFENYYGVDAITKATRDTELYRAYWNYDNITIRLSNAFYFDNTLPVKADFQNLLTNDYYYAGIENLNFHNDSNNVADIINQFCNDNTNGMIKEIIDSGTVQTLDSVLINALYFNGEWANPFEDDMINDLEFKNVDGTTATVDGMEEWGLSCYKNDNAIAFGKYYEGYDFEFVGILPNKDICDENGDFNVADIDIKDLLDSYAYSTEAHIILPKFKVEDTNSLKTALENEGLTNMFTWGEKSNFSKISDIDLVVTDVIQKTVVDVDAKGTEASAVTVVEMKCDAVAMPEELVIQDIILDRPFAFMIYDKRNDEILFIGKIVNLPEN